MAIYSSYWGKALPDEQAGQPFHPFACHSLDVIAVGMRWLVESRALARIMLARDGNEELAWAWLCFFLGLHDVGKLDQRFQCKALHVVELLAPERVALLSKMATCSYRYDHGSEGFRWALAELPQYLDLDEGDEDLYGDAWQPWLAAVTGHHGVLPRNTEPPHAINMPPPLRKIDREARQAWVKTLEAMFLEPVGLSLRDIPPPMPELLAGFCSVADWLGSNTEYFPYAGAAYSDLNDYLEERQERAYAVLRASGLVSKALSVGGMQSLFPERKPRQVQTLVDRLPRTAGMTLVEAPTGSGKTEAALAYAAYLLADGLADSVVFALPTQATANAMLQRLEAVADRLFPEDGANVVLAHGKSRYNPDFITLQQAARPNTVQSGNEALVQCALWLSQSRKRAFLGQIGVCTIDQVLLGALPVRHNFVRTFGIGRSVLIVDEVHAYDSYMYGLLEEVLRRQCRAGGSAVLLSATLPYSQRRRLAAAWAPDIRLEQASPYPLLTHVNAAGHTVYLQPEPAQQPLPHAVTITLAATPEALPDEETCRRILAAARAGACVAVICNLVDHAQRLARRLREMTSEIPIDLFHARYRFCDRQRREREIMDAYGPSRPSGRGRVLVATQVVEQSLDLDFDWLVTQLCPVDLLFQRFGRLHRHQRMRPDGFANPQVSVLLPKEADFGLHALIYGNVRVLWRTRQLLANGQEIHFPTAYRDWIERVYDEDDWPNEPAEIIAAADDWTSKQIAARQEALQLASDEVGAYADEDSRIQFLTRDGELGLTVLPMANGALLDGRRLEEFDDWEHAEILNQQAVSVPASWQSFLPEAEEGIHRLSMRAENGAWVIELDKVQLVYSEDYGMERRAL